VKRMDSVTVGADRLQTADPLRDEPERGSSLRAERPPMIDFDDRFSRRILIRLLILAIVAVALILGSLQFITQLYFENQLTMVGLAVNGAIVLLFVLGLARLVATLFRYAREERALGTFLGALDAEDENPAYEVDSRAMIVQRYHAVLRLTEHNVPVNHGALASTLMSNENTRLSFPRFVNNVLILTGVFGTIVALSIALVGASEAQSAIAARSLARNSASSSRNSRSSSNDSGANPGSRRADARRASCSWSES